MRPEKLFPLFSDIQALAGVGPRVAQYLERLAGSRVIDLLWHLPTGFVDRRWEPKISELVPGRIATLRLKIGKHRKSPRRGIPYKIAASDQTGKLTLVFFRAQESYLLEQLPEQSERIVSGRVDSYADKLQMVHPDYILKPDQRAALPAIEPVYPLTLGLSNRTLQKALKGALKEMPELPEWIDPGFLKQQQWPSWRQALEAAHTPKAEADIQPQAPQRQRLAYDELLASQMALALVRLQAKKSKGRVNKATGRLQAVVRSGLPFVLTASQEQVLGEIQADMAAPEAMLRLLQGDVGSGKTVVALLAMLSAVEAGAQAALAAPTEILARQHFMDLKPRLEVAGVRLAFLSGRTSKNERQKILTDLEQGRLNLIVGTHALLQEDVKFKDLGLVVVDEQHRFGVYQRLALSRKGRTAPDVLVMTATPIPRTLSLTVYGDMEVSRITEKPPGRRPVTTRVILLKRLDQVIAAMRRALEKGDRIYWVCPLVAESEVLDLSAAEDRFETLSGIFPGQVGLVHGRLKGEKKDAAMADFTAGRLQILVSTTVIEVGVDVPEATVMIVEHAERFGLAQLHQLRGRVGRSSRPSSCLLLRGENLSEVARSRLAIMRQTDDGFRIAEEDLRLRGAGEILGTRQSGFPQFRVVDLARQASLLEPARDDARLAVEKDPGLSTPRGRALRILLYLFEREAAVRYLKSG
ncbi:MAG: ATP-dependent DNA helicase RecG [Proteobacteria bacterium]|nr:ATP-dependent DNA helicase RecG [Pseudomonadota bacterium]